MIARALMLAGALALASCASTPKINYDSDPTANFSSYHSYSWVYTSVPQGMNPLLFQRVQGSIDNALAARGFSKAAPGDFAVAFTLGARDRVEVNDMGPYGPFYRGWGGWGGVGMYNNVDVRNVTDGTLTIDIYDAGTKKPVWHGTAKQEINSTEVDQAKIDAAVVAVLANFPPPNK